MTTQRFKTMVVNEGTRTFIAIPFSAEYQRSAGFWNCHVQNYANHRQASGLLRTG